LFEERGYDDTTVAEIAERAGLTKRTFFRYFADKREVLFSGSEELQQLIADGVASAPAGATPLDAVGAGLDAAGPLFADRRAFALERAKIIASNPELLERERMKLASLAEAIAAALRERGVGEPAATLAAEAGTSVFHVGFRRWLEADDGADLATLMRESLGELRSLAA
jgi:AcrR family transcriptional regulator